jgi:molecular chaperone GrpE
MSKRDKNTEEEKQAEGREQAPADRPEPDAEPENAAQAEEPLEEEQARHRQRLEELEDKYRRAVAELANAHKRFERERQRTARLAVARFVEKLLPMVDNMVHSLRSADESHNPADIIQGFRLVESQLLQIFSENGVRPIRAEGEQFDPEYHHAVTTEVRDDVAPGTVTEELGRGFTLEDVVVRPAQVKVAAAPPDLPDEGEEEESQGKGKDQEETKD